MGSDLTGLRDTQTQGPLLLDPVVGHLLYLVPAHMFQKLSSFYRVPQGHLLVTLLLESMSFHLPAKGLLQVSHHGQQSSNWWSVLEFYLP
jgi:hypothetical protein